MGLGVGKLLIELARQRVGLRPLLRLEPLAFQHIPEVAVAAKIQLVGAVDANPPFPEQIGQHAMNNGGSDLTFDIVADERQPALLKPAAPCRVLGNKNRDAVDQRAARRQRLLGVPS